MPEATEGPGWINRAASLQELWQRRFDWIQDAARTRAFVKRAIREGDFLVAYDAARETVEERQSADPWMQQQMALALAQLGSTARAQAILMTLVNKDPTNRETLALLARTYKDQWCTDTSNAAALVILRRRADAKKAYRSAAATPDLSLRELSSTRRQARLLSKHLYRNSHVFDTCFPIPKLVVFSGHMLDTAGRSVPRFPASKERSIRLAINKQLKSIGAGIGFSSAACGSDIIFLEAMLDRGANVHVVLPWPKEEFIQTSVAITKDDNWIARFEDVLRRAASVRVLGQLHVPGNEMGFD